MVVLKLLFHLFAAEDGRNSDFFQEVVCERAGYSLELNFSGVLDALQSPRLAGRCLVQRRINGFWAEGFEAKEVEQSEFRYVDLDFILVFFCIFVVLRDGFGG